MSQPSEPTRTAPPAPIASEPDSTDPDVPDTPDTSTAFAFGDTPAIGETERIARERAIYEAGRHGNDLNRGHALGGTQGSTEGQ